MLFIVHYLKHKLKVQQVVDPSCNFIFGTSIDPNLEDEVEITIIATGFAGAQFENNGEEQKQQTGLSGFGGFMRNSQQDKERQTILDINAGLFDPREKQQPVQPVKPEPEIKKQPESSIIDIYGEDDVPPFLKKIRNKG